MNWTREEKRERILKGAQLAIDRLVIERAKNDETMIIYRDDKIIELPAKILLEEMLERKRKENKSE